MAFGSLFDSKFIKTNRGFFEPLEYKRCIDRYEFGNQALTSFSSMLEERSNLELSYVNRLRTWSRKWHAELTKLAEYPTNKAVWDQIVSTGEQMADVHQSIASNIQDTIQPKLKQWRKDNYEKSFLRYNKTREIEKEFENIQKPWLKILETIEQAKEIYRKATKSFQQNEQQKESINEQTSAEQQKQIVDRYIQSKLDLETARTKYQHSLRDVSPESDHRQRYEGNMTEAFIRCQAFEMKRLQFFRTLFNDYTKTLEQQTAFTKMLENYVKTVETHNPEADLDLSYKTYGPSAPSNYPTFQEL